MGEFLHDTERDALRRVADLLPASWRRMIDVATAPVPPTPQETVDAPSDAAAASLDQVEHIVVVMLENRSFDHMLGYLSLPATEGGRGRTNVEGLTGPAVNSNPYDGTAYEIHHLASTMFKSEAEDPDHTGAAVDEQLANGGQGFVSNYARYSTEQAQKLNVPVPDPRLVMGYYNAEDLPVYDHLASEYCVVDRWFSSVPGSTWPNRLYALAGRAEGSRDDRPLPIYQLPSFARYLDQHQVDWRWYSFDPATLRAVDPAYRLTNHDRFAFVDSRDLSPAERAIGELTEEGPSFLDDVEAGKLPQVSWIDPRFKDLRVLGPDSNDDHPPTDVIAGQDLVLTIYHALSSVPTWANSLMVITYDEHGGFYDHVAPPEAADDDPEFRRLGVRVPTLLISPLVAAGSSSSELVPDLHFDHSSLIKTILTRFCSANGQIPRLTSRVQAAEHLGHLLSDPSTPARGPAADHSALVGRMVAWRQEAAEARFDKPVAFGGPPGRLTDFQTGFYDMAGTLRHAGLPAGHP